MPSTSPGIGASEDTVHPFDRIFPGNPVASLQSLDTFVYRHRRYITYISGSQLNILVQPNLLLQAVTFDHDLVAVAADDETGELLVAGARDVWLLRPQTEGWTKVWWEKALNLQREDAGDRAHRVSWGSDGEALIGGSRVLSLFSTRSVSRSGSSLGFRQNEDGVEKRQALWSKGIPSPLLFADFSPSASLIASCSHHDRLLKIWRRLSYEEGLFDHTYLPHPGSITHVQWRPHIQSNEEESDGEPGNRHDDDAEVLYTVANDAILRIWRTGGMHDADIMIQYATIDLVSSIPQSPNPLHKQHTPHSRPVRFLFILPSEQFCAAIRTAVGFSKGETVDHVTEHLNFMASQEPDVIVSFDGQGRMSAWGLQSIGHKRRPDTPSTPQAFHIAHAEDLTFELPTDAAAVFKPWIQDKRLSFLVHTLQDHGKIHWWEGDVKSLFSLSAPSAERLRYRCTWQGHDTRISNISVLGSYVTSQSLRDSKIWKADSVDSMTFSSKFALDPNVKSVVGLDQHRFITLQDSRLTLWDQDGRELASDSQNAYRNVMPYITSSTQAEASGFLLSPDDGGVARLTARFAALNTSGQPAEIEVMSGDTPEVDHDFKFSELVPAHGSIHSHVIACTSEGLIYRSHSFSEKTPVSGWKKVSETGVTDPIAFAAASEFAAIVSAANPGGILVVDMEDGYVQHRETFDLPIQHVQAITLKPQVSLLAVAFQDAVRILSRGQYSARRASDSTWLAVKQVSIRDVGLQINGIAWLPNATMVAAAGNGLFLSDHGVRVNALGRDLLESADMDITTKPNIELQRLSYYLQCPLPAWHPDFLGYIVDRGTPAHAAMLLSRLAQKLKFWSPGDRLDLCPDKSVEDLLAETEHAFDLSEDTITDLKEQLDEKLLPQLSHADQDRLKRAIDAFAFLKDHVNGLDQNALIFLYTWKLRALESEALAAVGQEGPKPSDGRTISPINPVMSWKEIAFARQSTTQQALLDFLVFYYDNKITWPIARNLGIAAWLSDREALEKVFEQLAQTAYRSKEPRDPVDASLYFLALHKKPTLIALWKIATGNKEQRSTMNFLKRDFNEAQSRHAAVKNAYALMGKSRSEYAAAFFLLADDAAAATNILADKCNDLPLAIAVARLYSGDGSSVLRRLLEDKVIPQAKKDNNRWLVSWCHTVMLERSQAAESLVIPLEGVKTWRQDEPSTLLLYRYLRQEPSKYEYAAILRAARILRNMGLWFSALDLVCQWDFKSHQTLARSTRQASTKASINGDYQDTENRSDMDESKSSQVTEPPSLLDGFTQPAQTQSTPKDDKAAREAKAAELLRKLKEKKGGQQSTTKSQTSSPAPTQFKEPDSNSLLESFGF